MKEIILQAIFNNFRQKHNIYPIKAGNVLVDGQLYTSCPDALLNKDLYHQVLKELEAEGLFEFNLGKYRITQKGINRIILT